MPNSAKSIAVSIASLAMVTSGIVATAGAPAYAAGSDGKCDAGHICFFKDYHQVGQGTYNAIGSLKSDQTVTLTQRPTRLQNAFMGPGFEDIDARGKIASFNNSHYSNNSNLNDSVSLVVNNTNDCLVMWPDAKFDTDNSRQKGIVFGPRTAKALVGGTLGPVNDVFSSAAVIYRNDWHCSWISQGNYGTITKNIDD